MRTGTDGRRLESLEFRGHVIGDGLDVQRWSRGQSRGRAVRVEFRGTAQDHRSRLTGVGGLLLVLVLWLVVHGRCLHLRGHVRGKQHGRRGWWSIAGQLLLDLAVRVGTDDGLLDLVRDEEVRGRRGRDLGLESGHLILDVLAFVTGFVHGGGVVVLCPFGDVLTQYVNFRKKKNKI